MPAEQVLSLTLEATVFNSEQLQARLAAISARNEPQAALAGRSNVGKSSLINAVSNRRKLAKTSAAPGKTRSINFYRADGFTLADLPGYGYARCSMSERKKWAGLIDEYMTTASGLRVLVLLLDCRVEPQQADRDLAEYARSRGLPLLPVLTKADKCSQAEQSARRAQWAAILDGAQPLLFSAVSRRGVDGLCAEIKRLCAAPLS